MIAIVVATVTVTVIATGAVAVPAGVGAGAVIENTIAVGGAVIVVVATDAIRTKRAVVSQQYCHNYSKWM